MAGFADVVVDSVAVVAVVDVVFDEAVVGAELLVVSEVDVLDEDELLDELLVSVVTVDVVSEVDVDVSDVVSYDRCTRLPLVVRLSRLAAEAPSTKTSRSGLRTTSSG